MGYLYYNFCWLLFAFPSTAVGSHQRMLPPESHLTNKFMHSEWFKYSAAKKKNGIHNISRRKWPYRRGVWRCAVYCALCALYAFVRVTHTNVTLFPTELPAMVSQMSNYSHWMIHSGKCAAFGRSITPTLHYYPLSCVSRLIC